jgi:hypothetical protein
MRNRSIIVLYTLCAVGCGVFGSDDGGPAEEQAPPPPPPKTPEENAKTPVPGEPIVGVFVSSSKGKDNGFGTNDRPVRTLAQGIALAKKQGQKVVACAETFEEDVEIVDGVSMYGYFDCSASEWKIIDRHAVVRSTSNIAVKATGIVSATRIEGFDFIARDLDKEPPSDDAKSSIGLVVRDSTALSLAKVLIHAGAGARGADGVEGPANVESGSPVGGPGAPRGASNVCPIFGGCSFWTKVRGAAGGTSQCAVGGAGGPGGAGGEGRVYASCAARPDGTYEPRGLPLVANASTAAGGVGYCAAYEALIPVPPFGIGTAGAAGADGNDGANGAWSLTKEGFVAGHGTSGENGAPGQGGGGGGGSEKYPMVGTCNDAACPNPPSTYYWTATGAGGGAGGCGGVAGTAGKGGGASIAALVVDSKISISASRLESGSGGRGGKGTLGSAGLNGGTGGVAADGAGGGGNGGRGGTSGLSGHGAPGPSIALAYTGAKPALDATELAPGAAAAGHGELRKTGAAGEKVLPAIAGESKKEHSF